MGPDSELRRRSRLIGRLDRGSGGSGAAEVASALGSVRFRARFTAVLRSHKSQRAVVALWPTNALARWRFYVQAVVRVPDPMCWRASADAFARCVQQQRATEHDHTRSGGDVGGGGN